MNLPATIEHWPVGRLRPYAGNARTHDAAQVTKIAASIAEFGFTNPILVDGEDGIIAGHGRLMGAIELGLREVPVIVLAHLSDAQRRAYVLADNRLALDAGWDEGMLAAELAALQADGFDLELTGFTDDELADLLDDGDGAANDNQPGEGSGALASRFLVPPFSVLSAREGWWQDRKRAWMALGIRSEEGRDIGAPTVNSSEGKYEYMSGRGSADGGSIFDPVLCEIAYRWFSPVGGLVLDPFAGGSVRGVVAGKLGRRYVGHELRGEQVAANRVQATEICADDDLPPVWIEGDSRGIDRTCADIHADMVFSCPPYADLEVYSDNPQDLSTLGYEQFREAYWEIIAKACARLREDRFAVWVIGEVRDKRGNYYNFVGDTIEGFRRAGLHYYNEAILVTAVGSLPVRAGKQFAASRKVGKTHQNVLVFVKGDGKRAALACGAVDVAMPEGLEDAPQSE